MHLDVQKYFFAHPNAFVSMNLVDVSGKLMEKNHECCWMKLSFLCKKTIFTVNVKTVK